MVWGLQQQEQQQQQQQLLLQMVHQMQLQASSSSRGMECCHARSCRPTLQMRRTAQCTP
jgi:hypothetical protein